MAKANVIANILSLTKQQADIDTIPSLYDEVVYTLGRQRWLTNVQYHANNDGGAIGLLNWLSGTVMIDAINYGGTHIGELSLHEVEYLNTNWRAARGRPHAYITDELTRGSFQLYPTPPNATKNPIGPQMFLIPDDVAALFVTEYRVNVIPWMEWPVAFLTIVREFSRESSHQNIELASAANAIGALMMKMLTQDGIERIQSVSER